MNRSIPQNQALSYLSLCQYRLIAANNVKVFTTSLKCNYSSTNPDSRARTSPTESSPSLVLASTRAGDDLCQDIYSEVFNDVKARELKHSSLAKTPRGRDRILKFLRRVRGSGLFAAWIVHKEFCLLSKLADLCLEPALHEYGIDFYHRGNALKFCNMAWFCLRTFESPAFLSKHLLAFQRMVRDRKGVNYYAFWRTLEGDVLQCEPKASEILAYFLLAGRQLGATHFENLPERNLDICHTSALQVVGHWRGRTEEDLEVIHDESSVMAKEKWMWDALTKSDFPTVRVGPSDFPVRYPLRVIKTDFGKSSAYLPLQFSDILAGAVAAYGQSLISADADDYSKALVGAGLREHLVGSIWPSPDVEPDELQPGTLGAGNFLKLVSVVLHEARKRS